MRRPRNSSSNVSSVWVKEAISAEAEGRAAALDRMRDAKNGVDQLRVGRADVQLQQRRLHRIERLEALFEERIVKLCQIDRHRPASRGSSSMSRRPRRPAAASRADARPRHATTRPAVRRSRTKAARSCSPAVSMRCRALTSRVTGSDSCSRRRQLRFERVGLGYRALGGQEQRSVRGVRLRGAAAPGALRRRASPAGSARAFLTRVCFLRVVIIWLARGFGAWLPVQRRYRPL